LSARGLHPRKTLGQNFMLDGNFAAAVARAGAPDERTLILEVGPGTGLLTAALLKAHTNARVLAMELDTGLAEILRETFVEEIAAGRLTVLEGDAMAGKYALSAELVNTTLEISARENRPRRVLCANLPYNIATPLLINLAVDEQRMELESTVATVQAELAERLLAKPGHHEYGAPTVLMALRADGQIARRVGKAIFWPRPEVDSAVIELCFKPWPSDSPLPSREGAGGGGLRRDEVDGFLPFLRAVFSQRRKMVHNVLKHAPALAELDIPPTARAEELPPETLLALYRHIRTNGEL
jgi:16S rRNA (adenine1518-N6/adenine1519-N6)-dimethyltransferase